MALFSSSDPLDPETVSQHAPHQKPEAEADSACDSAIINWIIITKYSEQVLWTSTTEYLDHVEENIYIYFNSPNF